MTNTNTNTNTFHCPGQCKECGYHCWKMKPGEAVSFGVHGNGQELEKGLRARDRYLQNIINATKTIHEMIDAGTFLQAASKKGVVSYGNSKTECPTINLPAFTTCSKRANGKCGCGGSGLCYAVHGMQAFKSSVFARVRCFYFWKLYPRQYKQAAIAGTMAYKLARWFDSGDCPSPEYFDMMVDVAREVPDTTYLAMTKQYEIVNAWCDLHGRDALPANLVILFSENTDGEPIENPYGFATTTIAR